MTNDHPELNCPLCGTSSPFFYYSEEYERRYHECPLCKGIFMHPGDHVSREEEMERYRTHNNDISDPGYRKFVAPLVKEIALRHHADDRGLDFGAGTGPVITHMLRQQQYNISAWDPFFKKDDSLLQSTYDYIVACEVIEHFHQPGKEFKKLSAMLNPHGTLLMKTDPWTAEEDFSDWYYKNDETHVFFYSRATFEWIRDTYGFSELVMDQRVILLIN